MEVLSAKPRLRLLLDYLSKVKDTRQSWKVAYPLVEVLFLVVCGTIASGDDYEDIVDWGQAHLPFLRGFAEFHHGIPCADWLRTVMNRINPDLFMACFSSWVAECWPDKLDLVAIDGKTSRRSHNRKTGQKALHLVSAFATNSRLVLGQEAVDEKSNEITAIPALVERLDLDGALVSIDAMGCNPNIAQSILDAGADYLLAVKDNQPTLHADIKSYFETAPSDEVEKIETVGKDHGRIEVRNHTVSHVVDWIASDRSYPGAPRFPKLTTIGMVESRIERGDKIETERDPTSPPACSRPQPSPKSCEATGPSKTTFTAASTSPSTRINHACVLVTAPRIWPSSATSLSIWFVKSRTSDPSKDAANAPRGTQNTCWRYWGRCDVNLDSLPWS
jgi:predicted transposase YbfD/YdcC